MRWYIVNIIVISLLITQDVQIKSLNIHIPCHLVDYYLYILKFSHALILANLASTIHIAKIGIAKINGLGCIIWMLMMLFAKFKYAKNANKPLK